MILHALLFKFARVMSQSMSQWTIIRTYSFLQCRSDAKVISVYTQEWDGELSDLDVETKELGLFDPLNLPAMPKNERRTVEKYLAWKSSNFTNAAA